MSQQNPNTGEFQHQNTPGEDAHVVGKNQDGNEIAILFSRPGIGHAGWLFIQGNLGKGREDVKFEDQQHVFLRRENGFIITKEDHLLTLDHYGNTMHMPVPPETALVIRELEKWRGKLAGPKFGGPDAETLKKMKPPKTPKTDPQVQEILEGIEFLKEHGVTIEPRDPTPEELVKMPFAHKAVKMTELKGLEGKGRKIKKKAKAVAELLRQRLLRKAEDETKSLREHEPEMAQATEDKQFLEEHGIHLEIKRPNQEQKDQVGMSLLPYFAIRGPGLADADEETMARAERFRRYMTKESLKKSVFISSTFTKEQIDDFVEGRVQRLGDEPEQG